MSAPTTPQQPTPKRKSILHQPASPSSPSSPSSTHTYTSLASVRRANKGKEPERGDRKNGWHLWSVEEQQQQRGRTEGGGHTDGGGDVEGGGGSSGGVRREVMDEKSGERRMSQWDLVSEHHRIFTRLSIVYGTGHSPKSSSSWGVCSVSRGEGGGDLAEGREGPGRSSPRLADCSSAMDQPKDAQTLQDG